MEASLKHFDVILYQKRTTVKTVPRELRISIMRMVVRQEVNTRAVRTEQIDG